jgi:isopentenyldiphosphate isomerase
MELIGAYDKKGNLIKIEERRDLLKEIEEYSKIHNDANFAVPVIYLMLKNSQDQFYVVKRGNKKENPFCYDKTVGGHITINESPYSNLYRETKEEIGVEILLTTPYYYQDLVNQTNTEKYAVVKQVDLDPWFKSVRKTKNNSSWVKRHRAYIFTGIYDGPISFEDNEAIDYKLFSKMDLLKEIEKKPHLFAADLEMLLKNYC